jgi:hypothetical protein
VLRTAASIASVLGDIPDGDETCVPILVFKALEIEICVRVLHPFRTFIRVSLVDAALMRSINRLKSEEWGRSLGRFLDGGRPPTLAETASYLCGLSTLAADRPDDVFALLKGWIRSRYPLAHRLWGPRGLARRIETVAIEYRNRYVHSRVARGDEVQWLLRSLWGVPRHDGLLIQTFRVLSRGLPAPIETAYPCKSCGGSLLEYPLREPDLYCTRRSYVV